MAVDSKRFCIRYLAMTVGLWIAIPVALGLLPALGFGAALGNGVILIAAAPAFASIFMAKIYIRETSAVPPWNFIGRIMMVLVPLFVGLGFVLNGVGIYLMFWVASATTPVAMAIDASAIWSVPKIHLVNTAFSAVLGVGVIFPLRAKGEVRKLAYRDQDESRKF